MLRCGTCGRVDAPRLTAWCCPCGGLWSLDGEPDPAIASRAAACSMGEGGTAEVAIALDGREARAKLELASPTLSFKDRGAVWLVAVAVELGAERVVIDSSGNAGTAVAAYAARAGLPCTVHVPASTSAGKLAQARAHGADVRLVDGTREAVAAAALADVERTGARYASHVYDPHFYEGTKQLVLELDPLPDVLLLPAGNGTLVLGAAVALRALGAQRTRIVAVQAATCAPIAAASARGDHDVPPVAGGPTVAEGVAIAAPPRGAEVLAAIRATGGAVLTVDDDEVRRAQRQLAGQGLYVEPTAALAPAALGQLPVGADVVVPLCGAGLKATPVG